MKTFDCSLLYSDTDSLLFAIRGEDFYQKITNDRMLQNHVDFLNDGLLHCDTNKMITPNFKDEIGGNSSEISLISNPRRSQ